MTNVFTLSAFKSTRGHEGVGFTANLLMDGKKVAEVADYADGAPINFYWLDTKVPRVGGLRRRYDGVLCAVEMTPAEKAFNDLVNAKPAEQCPFSDPGVMHHITEDEFVSSLATDVEVEKRVARLLKTKVLWIEGGQMYQAKLPDPARLDAACAHYLKQNPARVILNKLPLAEAVRVARPCIVA